MGRLLRLRFEGPLAADALGSSCGGQSHHRRDRGSERETRAAPRSPEVTAALTRIASKVVAWPAKRSRAAAVAECGNRDMPQSSGSRRRLTAQGIRSDASQSALSATGDTLDFERDAITRRVPVLLHLPGPDTPLGQPERERRDPGPGVPRSGPPSPPCGPRHRACHGPRIFSQSARNQSTHRAEQVRDDSDRTGRRPARGGRRDHRRWRDRRGAEPL